LFSPSGRVDGGQDPFADAPVMVVAHGEESRRGIRRHCRIRPKRVTTTPMAA